jgi:hypothetical protein
VSVEDKDNRATLTVIETFDVEILDDIIARQSLEDVFCGQDLSRAFVFNRCAAGSGAVNPSDCELFRPVDDRSWLRYNRCDCVSNVGGTSQPNRAFTQFGGASLHRRFATSKNDVTIFLKNLMDALVFLDNSKSATARQRYTYDLCHAVAGITYSRPVVFYMALPDSYSGGNWPFQGAIVAAAAAVGNIDLLQILTSSWKDLSKRDVLFLPNALCAAVASNQVEAVQWMLRYPPRASGTGRELEELLDKLLR